jgi:hypothetical protein
LLEIDAKMFRQKGKKILMSNETWWVFGRLKAWRKPNSQESEV